MLFPPCIPAPGRAPVMDPLQTSNRHENSIPKHIWFHFQNRLCVSYNAVTVPIIKNDPGFFLSILGTWPNPQNWEFYSHCFIQIGKNSHHIYNQIKLKLANKNISTLWIYLTGTFYWGIVPGIVSQNSDIFLFIKLGIFSLILEKKNFFAIGNMTQNWSSKCAKKPCLVYQKYKKKQLHLYHYTYSRQIYIAS